MGNLKDNLLFLEVLAEIKGHPFWINESFKEHTPE